MLLSTYSQRSLENARQAKDELFGYQNSRKARLGGLAGLQDPAIMERKRDDEKKLRDAVAKDPALKDDAGAWDDVSKAIDQWNQIYVDWGCLEVGTAFNSELFDIARTLVRMADEDTKDNAERLPEYQPVEPRIAGAATVFRGADL